MADRKIVIGLWLVAFVGLAVLLQRTSKPESDPADASATVSPIAHRDSAALRQCDRFIRTCERLGACGKYTVTGDVFVRVEVGPAFYAMTFEEKGVLAKAFRYRERLVDYGGVEFVDLYSGRSVAELNALGFKMKQ